MIDRFIVMNNLNRTYFSYYIYDTLFEEIYQDENQGRYIFCSKDKAYKKCDALNKEWEQLNGRK